MCEEEMGRGILIGMTSVLLQLFPEWALSFPETNMVFRIRSQGTGLQCNLHAAPSSGWPSPEAQLASLGFHEPNY